MAQLFLFLGPESKAGTSFPSCADLFFLFAASFFLLLVSPDAEEARRGQSYDDPITRPCLSLSRFLHSIFAIIPRILHDGWTRSLWERLHSGSGCRPVDETKAIEYVN